MLRSLVALLLGATLAAGASPAWAAEGRRFWLWWLYGCLLLPIALVHAVVLRR